MIGDTVFEKYGISATPTALILDQNGNEIDWLVSYTPPPDGFLERIEKSLRGEDTYKSLSESYAADPKNVEVVFKLAMKYDQKFSTQDKAAELFRQVVALDPLGKTGTTDVTYPEVTVSYTEYAEYLLARKLTLGRTATPEPMREFINKYPASPLMKTAYLYLSIYFGSYASQEEAHPFFEEYTAKYPDDPAVLGSYIRRIIRDKEPLDKGIALAEEIAELTAYHPDPYDVQNLAELYALKGDKEKTAEVFGPDYIQSQVSSLAYTLASYTRFWLEKNANTENAGDMVELAVELQPETLYILQTAATFYSKTDQMNKALAVYGPEIMRKSGDDASPLYSYAYFWNREGKNLESALEAIQKSIALEPYYYKSQVLAQIQLKLENYEEALKAAEEALALAEKMAGLPTEPYEMLIKQVKAAKDKK